MVLSMERWVGKVAIVTGASSGIGAAIAEKLVIEGIVVVGLARRKDKMEELANKLFGKRGKFYPLQTDITKEEDILESFKWIKRNLGPIHILVNNAGVVKTGILTETETETWNQIFKVNVFGLLIATREAVKDMKANKVDGHIIHINSVGGQQVPNFPGLNVYPASKFAIRALAETLRLELNAEKSKIKITNLSPAIVLTEMSRVAAGDHIRDLVEEMVKEKFILKPEDIAEAVGYVLSTPPHVQIQELTIRTV